MKILKRIGLIIALFTVFNCSPNSNIVKGNLYKLSNKLDFSGKKFAIFPFKSSSEGKTFTSRVSTDGNAIADILTIQMMYKGHEVVEREKLNKVFEESKLSLKMLLNHLT